MANQQDIVCKTILKHMKNYILLLFSLMMALHLNAQDNDQGKFWVMGVPQHLFNNGVRIETDIRLGGQQHHWLVIAPVYYHRDKPGSIFSERWDTEGMEGGGLNVYYRRYFNEKSGYYVSGGGGFRMINYEMNGFRWDTFEENGLEYYSYNPTNYRITYSTAIFDALTGYKLIADPNFALDFYAGFGFRYTLTRRPGNTFHYINQEAPGMGYSGFILLAGARIGVGW